MISHFTNIGYTPIVGDSFTGDTPLFIKYNNTNLIDIKPIKELIDEKQIQIDGLGREYDYSTKPYKVLCRSGWVEPEYIYRHKTNKPIYTVKDGDMLVEVTEDHSLFNDKQEKIKPTELNSYSKLEYYNGDIFTDFNTLTEQHNIEDTWLWLLNASIDIKKRYLETVQVERYKNDKITLAKIQFIKKCVKEKQRKNL